METRCRVEDETREFLEAEARAEEEQELRDMRAEMFKDLDVQLCECCKTQWPASEFAEDGFCLMCNAEPTVHGEFVETDGKLTRV